MTDNGIRLAVVGKTGSGKTAFVRTVVEAAGFTQQQATGLPGNPLKSSSDGESCTDVVMKAQVKVDGIVVQLWDTPGFDDSGHRDASIFHEIVEKMSVAEKKGYRFNGVILLESITEPRVVGSEKMRIKMIKEMIGSDAYGQVAIVGTKWNQIVGTVGETGEGNRKRSVWQDLIAAGAWVFRFDERPAAALQIVRHFVANRGNFDSFTPKVVAELQHNNGNVAGTSAHKELDGTLTSRENDAREQSKLLGGDEELEETASKIVAARTWLREQVIKVWRAFKAGVTILTAFDLAENCTMQ